MHALQLHAPVNVCAVVMQEVQRCLGVQLQARLAGLPLAQAIPAITDTNTSFSSKEIHSARCSTYKHDQMQAATRSHSELAFPFTSTCAPEGKYAAV
jgi:hypothetical protein